MQVSIETTSGLERRLTISLPASQIDTEVDTRLKQSASKIRLDGFRPGKIPLKVMKQRFGGEIRQEVIQDQINKSFSEAIVQEKLEPAGMPTIEPKNLEEGKDVEFVAIFEVFPEVEAKEYDGIELTQPVVDITDADIDTMIESLQKQMATWKEVKKKSKKGNQVNIDFKGTKDGEAFEGGSAEGSDLVLGSGSMIPGFEDGIIGMKAGEEKTISVTFPEDYQSEELKGADAEFEIKVNTVSEQELPELNDEFFEKYGVKEGGIEAFKEDVKKNMQREADKAVKENVKNQIMDALLEQHQDMTLPAALIKQEISNLKQMSMQQFGGVSPEMDINSLLPDDLFQEQAERRVRIGLVLKNYIQEKGITADPTKVREFIEAEASTYESPEEVINYYYSNQNHLVEVENVVIEASVVDLIKDAAKVTEDKQSYSEFLPVNGPAEQNLLDICLRSDSAYLC